MNNIVNRYLKGQPLPVTNRQATFGDFNSVDFQEMQNAIADINNEFNGLPAKLRSKFGNNPHQLLRWLENPANKDTAVKLGLIKLDQTPYDPDAILATHAQLDLEREAARAAKADPEAQPGYRKPGSTEAGNAGKTA